MKEFFRFPKKDDFQPQIKESLDRKNRQPLGNLLEDEDEERVNRNDPRRRFKTVDDLVDDSYLTFGEEIEVDYEELEELEEDEEVDDEVDDEERSLAELLDEYKMKNNFNRPVHLNKKIEIDDFDEVDFDEVGLDDVDYQKEMIENNEKRFLEKERRGMGRRNDSYPSKKIRNYNLKTEPESKTQRRLRGEIKNFMDKNI